jgi:benzoyl-CoA reductase/2-hydroxyglutaryl-CoA dehydratase subunit BcrC/BadD/HgdB
VKTVAFTSTIPVEAVIAAGLKPLDLNNVFVMADNPSALVADAKLQGFPDTTCAWICGLFGTVLAQGIDTIVGVTGGDCSETLALMEILKLKGRRLIPFGYPHDRDEAALRISINRFCEELGTDYAAASRVKERLDIVRGKAARIDELLWKEDRGTGSAARLHQLCCTDFNGDVDGYEKGLDAALSAIQAMTPARDFLRIGICGVPPIVTDLYDHIEHNGVRVVYSEVERQFSVPYMGDSLERAYSRYTYPYGIFARLEDINTAVDCRRLDGIIHYVQSFCFRGIEDIALRASVKVPVLTLQGDLPSRVSETMEIRIEAFLDMLARRKKKSQR